MKESAYAITARQVIERTLQQHGRQDPKQLRRAIRSAYPFRRRAGWAYKIWLREVKTITGLKNRNTLQPDLFDGGEA